MQLLIKFPTRNRPEKFLSVLELYRNHLDQPQKCSFLVSADLDDTSMNNDQMKDHLAATPRVQLCFGANRSKIEAVNANMDQAPAFDILLLASDDMIPVTQGFDAVVRNRMQTHFPDTDGALFFNDGRTGPELNTLCILGRKYYERFGYIYHPAYQSFYCDNEYTLVGKALNRLPYFPEVLIRHNHYTFVHQKPDALYLKNRPLSFHDSKVFAERKAQNFPHS